MTASAPRPRKRQKHPLAGSTARAAELFPTPPWATRALFRHVLPAIGIAGDERSSEGARSAPASGASRLDKVWEPCAGLGHMSEVIAEFVDDVVATDLHPFVLDDGRVTGDLDIGFADVFDANTVFGHRDRWIVTNPPFSRSADLVDLAHAAGVPGLAILQRHAFLESGRRHALFRNIPPSLVALFSERVPMTLGGWDPAAKTNMPYAWFVWLFEPSLFGRPGHNGPGFPTILIPPTCRAFLSRPSDDRLAARHVPGFVPPSARTPKRVAA